MAEGKEVDRGVLSNPQETKDAVGHTIHFYDEHFAKTDLAPARKAE